MRDHGTIGRYREECRCDLCRWVSTDRRRRQRGGGSVNDNVWLPLSTVPVPGDWVLDAECRGLDPGLFVQERGEHGSDHAKEVCRRCSVITDCLEYALPHPRLQGIFGGLSGRDRRLLRKSRLKEAS